MTGAAAGWRALDLVVAVAVGLTLGLLLAAVLPQLHRPGPPDTDPVPAPVPKE